MKKTLILIVTIILLLNSMPFVIGETEADPSKNLNENSSNNECHVIDGVPFVAQETGYDCELSSFAMLVRYFEPNYSFHEIFYLIGAGYALASRPRIGSYCYELPFALFYAPYRPYVEIGRAHV